MPDDPTPLLIPDYLSEDNWNRILDTLVLPEAKDLATFRGVAEECDSIERVSIEAGRPFRRIAVDARAWERWIKEQDVLGDHGLMDAFCWCEYQKVAEKEGQEATIRGLREGFLAEQRRGRNEDKANKPSRTNGP